MATERDQREAPGGGQAPDEVSETFRDWYASMLGRTAEEDPTIGLFGGRGDSARYGLGSRSRMRRIAEIVSIVRRYDILHGLTPVSFRQMLEELGPTFVKAGQILSMRSEILPEPFCRELSRLRTHVEPMDREVVLATLRAEYDLSLIHI